MNFNRIISLLIYLVYLGFAIKEKAVVIALFPLLGLVFIWFPSMAKIFDSMGAVARRSAPMDPDTPSCAFALIGWAILLSPVFMAAIAKLASM
ncbi:MAG: hypothetical protein KKB51_15130 [Candidatus Riflebacteria bacterium]|nr:hypothetical protein [Candidatus Riflebacteria bacterium]